MDIDLTEIDWNKISIDEYHSLEKKLQESHSLNKKNKIKEKRTNGGLVTVILRGNPYQLKEIVYKRLKSMKSKKSKENLIDEIISQNNPIETID